MKNIYLLYGENRESLKEEQERLAKKYLKNDFNEFTYVKFNMLETEIEELIYECKSSGFFSEKKVIVAENSIFLEAKPKKIKVQHNIDLLSNYFNNINDDVMLIFLCSENIDNRKKIIKQIKDVGEIIQFSEMKEKDIVRYIVTYFKEKNIIISNDTALFLLNYSKLDFSNIKRELEKLTLICSEKQEVLRSDIEKIVVKSIDYDIFSLTNFLFTKKYNELLSLINNLKIRGEEPIMLLSLITSQLRIYYKVKILLQNNYTQKDIASKLSVHPYRVQLASSVVGNYNTNKLLESIMLCKEYDELLKSSYIDKNILFDIFVNKLIEKIG